MTRLHVHAWELRVITRGPMVGREYLLCKCGKTTGLRTDVDAFKAGRVRRDVRAT